MGSVVVYGPYSPKEFSTLGDASDFAADGTVGTLNRRLFDDIGSAAVISAEPVLVLGNVYLVVSR